MGRYLLACLVILAVATAGTVWAGNTGKIAGEVKDAQTGEPVIGASVLIEGTTQGAATNLDGYYVAIGTSGHQFKAAPFVGEVMATLVDSVESGHDHDADPLVVRGTWTGVEVNLAQFSRLRPVEPHVGMR